ncbi:MAG: hypothetical protein K0S55_69 [Clostridia bacterium]|jgi:FKBP-type peptidyl-prolyl cis-trans isomerase (trigger factor)|nr:hypothetical protein [Clostridia bacterium]
MDIKEKIDEIIVKIKDDKNLADKFKANPLKAIETLIDVDLPDEMINNIISGIKAKLTADKVDDFFDGIKKMF